MCIKFFCNRLIVCYNNDEMFKSNEAKVKSGLKLYGSAFRLFLLVVFLSDTIFHYI